MNDKNIYPSILDADPDKLMVMLKTFKNHDLTGLHIDVMDGNYVPSYGFDDRFVKWINKNTSFYQDVHLMVDNPESAIKIFANAGADGITIHYNTANDLYYLVEHMNSLGVNSGVALNPAERPEMLKEVLPLLNHVLVMTCSPGRPSGGSILSMAKKVSWLNKYRKENQLDFRIQVDGGINSTNIQQFAMNGCDDFVSGGFITKTNKIDDHINELNNMLK